jgi:hypothetical protein
MFGRADVKLCAILLAACLPTQASAEDVNLAELTCSAFTQKVESISSESAEAAYGLALSTWLYGFTAAKNGVTTISGVAAENFLSALKRECVRRPQQSVLAGAQAVAPRVLKQRR